MLQDVPEADPLRKRPFLRRSPSSDENDPPTRALWINIMNERLAYSSVAHTLTSKARADAGTSCLMDVVVNTAFIFWNGKTHSLLNMAYVLVRLKGNFIHSRMVCKGCKENGD